MKLRFEERVRSRLLLRRGGRSEREVGEGGSDQEVWSTFGVSGVQGEETAPQCGARPC